MGRSRTSVRTDMAYEALVAMDANKNDLSKSVDRICYNPKSFGERHIPVTHHTNTPGIVLIHPLILVQRLRDELRHVSPRLALQRPGNLFNFPAAAGCVDVCLCMSLLAGSPGTHNICRRFGWCDVRVSISLGCRPLARWDLRTGTR